MHGHFISHRTRVLAEWMVHLQRRCSLTQSGPYTLVVYVIIERERTFPCSSETLLSYKNFSRKRNHFKSINQQNCYLLYQIKQVLLQSSLECQQIQHMLIWLSVPAISWFDFRLITSQINWFSNKAAGTSRLPNVKKQLFSNKYSGLIYFCPRLWYNPNVLWK